MNKKDRKLLENDGWTIVCESPLEIELTDDETGDLIGTATGDAVTYIVEVLKYWDQQSKSY